MVINVGLPPSWSLWVVHTSKSVECCSSVVATNLGVPSSSWVPGGISGSGSGSGLYRIRIWSLTSDVCRGLDQRPPPPHCSLSITLALYFLVAYEGGLASKWRETYRTFGPLLFVDLLLALFIGFVVVPQVWGRCGAGVGQVWGRCGAGAGQVLTRGGGQRLQLASLDETKRQETIMLLL